MEKFLRMVILLAVVLMLAGSAGAEYYNEGHAGTAADPYVIDTNADLVALRDRVNAGTEAEDKFYKLTQNLDISQYPDWEPIGAVDYHPSGMSSNPFTGHFDGNNLTIHVNIDREKKSSALFGDIRGKSSDVSNLNVSGTIKGRWAAGIAEGLNYGKIDNCSFTGTLSCDYGNYANDTSAAGIVTSLSGGTITNCTVEAQITSGVSNFEGNDMGTACGIAAFMSGGIIEDCKVTSISDGIYATLAGGIVGIAFNPKAIKNCTFLGRLRAVEDAGGIAVHLSGGNARDNHITYEADNQTIIMGNGNVGGIAGQISSGAVLESCDVSSGVRILTEGEDGFEIWENGGRNIRFIGVGGIVGFAEANFTLSNNLSYASIISSFPYQGGVVGKIDGANYDISGNRYSYAGHGIGNNNQNEASDEGCLKIEDPAPITPTMPITPQETISITTKSLPYGVVGKSYSASLSSNPSGATWTLVSGKLPDGLTLSSSGTISGTPTTAGTYTFAVRATQASSVSDVKEFTITIHKQSTTPVTTITITTTSLPSGTVGTSYSATLTASISNAAWSITSGSLPNGLTLNSSGRISGTPTASGTSTFTVRAVSGSASTTKNLSITINQGSVTPTPNTSITITTTSLPSGTAGESYRASLASNPSGATWAVSAGSLPAGLSLSSSGTISGTPTSAGTAAFTVRATYGSASTTQNLSITINAASLSITTSSLPSGRVGSAYRETLRASTSGVTWSVYAGSLPNGLTLLESQGIISGTPTSSGTFSFTLQARTAYASTTKSFRITIYSSSNSNNSDTGESSGGGGCDSGVGLLGLAVLGSAFTLRRKD